ncbi:MAG: PIN domain-containing protein [Spirochaetaceae bacterium]|nr:PIN domain-containing protein [Spirochaetaceae bacterium]
MVMKRGDIVFLDTNVLLAATDTGRRAHAAAVSVFTKLTGDGIHLAVSGQVIREYLVVATRPVEQNGLGLKLHDALDNAAEFRSRTIFLEETHQVAEELVELIRSAGIHGKRIHDLNIAATMLSHGIRNLISFNPGDFSGIGDIEVRVPE